MFIALSLIIIDNIDKLKDIKITNMLGGHE
jgi:hypothetical protein